MPNSTAVLALAALLTTAGCAHKQWERALAGEQEVVIEPGEGVGNLRLGMGRAKVRRRVGQPTKVDRLQSGEQYWTYPELGLSVRFEGHRLDALYCYSGVHGGYETRDYQPFPGSTVGGVGMRSTQREVLEAFGKPARWDEDPRAPIPATWLTYEGGLSFCFTARDQRLVYLSVD
jgi:hypothetical protein